MRVGDVIWPQDTALVTLLREGRVIVPSPDDPLESGDELLFVTTEDVEGQLEDMLSPHHHRTTSVRTDAPPQFLALVR